MTRHPLRANWPDELPAVRAELLSTPEGRAAWMQAKAELDACWTVVCREGLCVWWVSPDSDHRDYFSGVGPIDCPCKRNEP
jgi:hypothetical protein